jgi:hypothetical protein
MQAQVSICGIYWCIVEFASGVNYFNPDTAQRVGIDTSF